VNQGQPEIELPIDDVKSFSPIFENLRLIKIAPPERARMASPSHDTRSATAVDYAVELRESYQELKKLGS
jgi:hypothetical protein